jgi:hypothetical protein
MKSVKVQITPGKKASSSEAIFRIFWALIVGIILHLLWGVVGFLTVLNFFTCLLMQKRFGAKFTSKIITQTTQLMAYATFVTDERPSLLPDF